MSHCNSDFNNNNVYVPSRKSTTASIEPDDGDNFVSPDVNEALQGARQIVTEGRVHDKDPNERIIDESASVKITKTGGDDQPFEITVTRSKVFSRRDLEEEDAGWSSDTDVIGRSRLQSTTKKCLHQRKASVGAIAERHTNVTYRHRPNELWRRSDSDLTTGPVHKDETELQVDFKEECHTQEGAHVVTQVWQIRWTVQHFQDLPEWMQDNEFLHTGHRPPIPSFSACFKSILYIHTETGNIWTHLIGCAAFLILATWFLTRPDAHIKFQEKLVFSFFFLGAVICLGFSFIFHTVSCHSKDVVHIFSRLDYMGISLLIVGSFIPWVYYGFYCRRVPKITYITMIVVFGVAAIVASLWNKFNDKRYRPLRAAIFTFMGLSGLIPSVHFVITDGLSRFIEENSFYCLLTMAVLYLIGALLYVTRTPERFFPGKCDLLFQSHQIFHVCVVIAALAHYYGVSQMAMLRLTGTCPHIQTTAPHHPHTEL